MSNSTPETITRQQRYCKKVKNMKITKNYEALSEEEKMETGIGCWELVLEYVWRKQTKNWNIMQKIYVKKERTHERVLERRQRNWNPTMCWRK